MESSDQTIDVERYLAYDEPVPSIGTKTSVSFASSDAWALPPGE
jgi:hypothetical protein